jgi:UDP-glucose 4-epimerase
MKVFITGGMGFIGSYIVMELLRNGHEVTILARNPDKIPAFGTMPGIRVVRGGLADFDVIAAALPGHEVCIHNALYWGNSATEMLRNDTRCAVQLFETAASSGVSHLLYTSSTAALGEFRPSMQEEMKLKPTDFYGATKAATEAYLLAFGRRTQMRCNVIRPGYTIGNPVVDGAPIYSDARFKNIVRSALTGTDIEVAKGDGTQFIWAGDLARIYTAVLNSDVNRGIYFGLAKNFTTWEAIAREAVAITGSASPVSVADSGRGGEPLLFTMEKIEKEFGLAFDSTEQISDHLRYLVQTLR